MFEPYLGQAPGDCLVFTEAALHGSMVKVPPWQHPSSAPVPPQSAPGGSWQLGTPGKQPTLWAPSHCLGCSS